jgi:hypothetical protein
MGCDRGTHLSILRVHLHARRLAPRRPERRLRLGIIPAHPALRRRLPSLVEAGRYPRRSGRATARAPIWVQRMLGAAWRAWRFPIVVAAVALWAAHELILDQRAPGSAQRNLGDLRDVSVRSRPKAVKLPFAFSAAGGIWSPFSACPGGAPSRKRTAPHPLLGLDCASVHNAPSEPMKNSWKRPSLLLLTPPRP